MLKNKQLGISLNNGISNMVFSKLARKNKLKIDKFENIKIIYFIIKILHMDKKIFL